MFEPEGNTQLSVCEAPALHKTKYKTKYPEETNDSRYLNNVIQDLEKRIEQRDQDILSKDKIITELENVIKETKRSYEAKLRCCRDLTKSALHECMAERDDALDELESAREELHRLNLLVIAREEAMSSNDLEREKLLHTIQEAKCDLENKKKEFEASIKMMKEETEESIRNCRNSLAAKERELQDCIAEKDKVSSETYVMKQKLDEIQSKIDEVQLVEEWDEKHGYKDKDLQELKLDLIKSQNDYDALLKTHYDDVTHIKTKLERLEKEKECTLKDAAYKTRKIWELEDTIRSIRRDEQLQRDINCNSSIFGWWKRIIYRLTRGSC